MIIEKNLIYDWNNESRCIAKNVEINDESLRDGIQGVGLIQPSIEEKKKLLYQMSKLGIDSACIGFPFSSEANYRDIEEMVDFVNINKIPLKISCAARTQESDIISIIKLSQKYGIQIDANIFIGSSPIRQYVEGWDIKHIVNLTERAVSLAVKNNLNVCFVTEDTTRSKPEELRMIYSTAIESGAYRICLCDTVGHADNEGTKKIITFAKEIIQEHKKNILIDWHGHNDKGLAVSNSLAAIEAGVDRIHATGLGIGERTGNTSMEQLLVNLKYMKIKDVDLSEISKYCNIISEMCHVEIPNNLPIIGKNAFRTSTGVHASAIVKALSKDNTWLADRVYSSVSAKEVGLEQIIDIGPFSGKSNVYHWLQKNNIDHSESLVNEILKKAKNNNKILEDEDIFEVVKNNNKVSLYNRGL